VIESKSRGVLDTPLEPVIGLAEGETRWRGMTTEGLCACARNTLSCHHPRKRVIQYSRDVSDGIERPRRTGYLAGACHRARQRRDPMAGYDG